MSFDEQSCPESELNWEISKEIFDLWFLLKWNLEFVFFLTIFLGLKIDNFPFGFKNKLTYGIGVDAVIGYSGHIVYPSVAWI